MSVFSIEERIFEPYKEGRSSICLNGCSLDDQILTTDQKISPLRNAIKTYARSLGMAAISFSYAGGVDYHFEDERDRQTVEGILKFHELLNIPQDQNELSLSIRGISKLLKTSPDIIGTLLKTPTKWATGEDLRFLIILEFAEHLFPNSEAGYHSKDQMLVAELLNLASKSLAARTSGNFLIVHGRQGLIDSLASEGLYEVHLPQPNVEDIKQSLPVMRKTYPNAQFEPGLDDLVIANLVSGTPLRPLEEKMRASHRTGKVITAAELTKAKEQGIITLSEGTLSVLNVDRVRNVSLEGQNVLKAGQLLKKFGQALREGNGKIPSNLILVGAPGTGKTDLALVTALEANAPAFQIQSPKTGVVGETERKVMLLQTILSENNPHIAFIDEITESLPLERGEFNGDSGASHSVTAGLLSILSDESRRGKSLLIGTTNCPWRMGAAMRGRFIFIPILHPLLSDFPAIIISTTKRISTVNFDAFHPLIKQAAEIFYYKGASARHIRSAISQASLYADTLTPEIVFMAAQDFYGSSDLGSAIYADLWAIKVCSFKSLLPWGSDPSNYPFPEYLSGIINPTTGDLNPAELEKAIEKYKSYGNL